MIVTIKTSWFIQLNYNNIILIANSENKTEIIRKYGKCDHCAPKKSKFKDNTIIAIDYNSPATYLQIDLSFFEGKIICSLIDCFSKKDWSKFIQSKYSYVIVSFIKEWKRKEFQNVVLPNNFSIKIQNDNASEFVNNIVNDLLVYYKIRQVKSAPYKPDTNGVIDRYNRTLKSKLKSGASNQKSEDVVEQYNKTPHTSTKDTPNNLWYYCFKQFYCKYWNWLKLL